MKLSDPDLANPEAIPQSDMKKADERDSRDANQNETSDCKAGVSDYSVVAAKIESEAQVDQLTSALYLPSGGVISSSSNQLSSTGTSRKLRSRTRLMARPNITPKPLLLDSSDDVSTKRSNSSDSSPEPPKTSIKKKERDATPSPLKLNRKTSKPQPISAANSQSVSQSSDLIAIFIDGSNLFYAASHLNIEVDYRRLLTSLVRGRRLLRAYFYTGVDPQNEKQRGFLLWLNRHGHRVVSKELTNLPDGSRRANMHVEMAVDMMRISEYCSNITLLGGDGNLAYALQVLSQRGTFIEVVSLQSMTSDSLIDLADSYTDLADLRDEIKR